MLGGAAGAGEGQTAVTAAQTRQEEEVRAEQARKEAAAKELDAAAVKAREDAAAKARQDTAAKAREDAAAKNEAARRAGADAGATGGVAGQGTPGLSEPAAGKTTTPDAPPAGDRPDSHGNEGGGRAATNASEEVAPPPSTEAAPENPGAMVRSAAGTRVPGRGPGPRPAGSGTSAGSAPQLQRDWASTSDVSSGPVPGVLTAAVNAVRTQFADYRGQLQDFAQGAQSRLIRLEQSVAVSFFFAAWYSCFFL